MTWSIFGEIEKNNLHYMNEIFSWLKKKLYKNDQISKNS
jgi:hypothetical protein